MDDQNSRILVTGMGLVTSNGRGLEECWRNTLGGVTGVKWLERFNNDGLKTKFAATVDYYADAQTCQQRIRSMAEEVLEEALSSADLSLATRKKTKVFLAVPGSEIEWNDRYQLIRGKYASENPHQLLENNTTGEFVRALVGSEYPITTANTACASGATVLQLACEAIRSGEVETAIAIGSDSMVNEEGIVRFSLLNALSEKNDTPANASCPFSGARDGFVMGEGAAAVVVQKSDAATAKDGVFAEIKGYGDATDNYHRTRSTPSGEYIIRCMSNAINDANLVPNQISYVNAHGTSTPENDKMEALGIESIFGANGVPVTSNKSMLGHTLTAAGLVEGVLSLLSIRDAMIPPNINYKMPDDRLNLNVVANNAQSKNVQNVISNSFGFGGQNVSIIFSKI